jgi:hypothetical protein
MRIQRLLAPGLALAAMMVSGCGGGGGGGSQAPVATTVITGMASKGPLKTGTVKVYAIRNGVEDRSAPVGQGGIGPNGSYTVDAGSYQGPAVVEVTGGTFTDEVSGGPVTLKVPLRTLVSNVATGTKTVAITPLTDFAYKMATGAGALSVASIDDANARVSGFYSVGDIVSTLPAAAGAAAEKKYAFVLGAFAQMVNDNINTGTGETRDDALARVMTAVGDEAKNGGFSIDTITKMNSAITAFAGGGSNQTGTTVPPIPVPTAGLLKMSTAGAAATIGAVDITITLPAGVTVAADAVTGEVAPGALAASGAAAAAGSTLASGKVTAAAGGNPATLRLSVVGASGFGTGEFVTVKFTVLPGGTFPSGPAAFTVPVFSAVALNGNVLGGITGAPSSVVAAAN